MSGSPNNAAAGVKRKREAGPKMYAVHKGKVPGIYHQWSDCQAQTTGFRGAVFKSFTSLTDAQAFVKNGLAARTSTSGPQKWYGVRVGKKPGVYTSWSEAWANIEGAKAPKYKSFASKVEAEAFVQGNDAVLSADVDDAAKSKKKTKKAREPLLPTADTNAYAPGEGPLPSDTEDGFDPRIYLNPKTQEIEYKTEAQLHATRPEATRLANDGVLKIWTDGSSRGNGTAGAVAGVGVYFGPNDRRNLAEPLVGPRQTNQRSELTAILRALELSPRDRPIMILSDSNYAINCVTTWFQKWRANGWQNSANKAVENKDLIEKILGYIEEREKISNAYGKGRARVSFVWVKGHAADEGNIAADKLAVEGAGM